MKKPAAPQAWSRFKEHPTDTLMIQAPLPNFLDTLPILVTIEGHGSGRQGPPPLAPPEEPANDN